MNEKTWAVPRQGTCEATDNHRNCPIAQPKCAEREPAQHEGLTEKQKVVKIKKKTENKEREECASPVLPLGEGSHPASFSKVSKIVKTKSKMGQWAHAELRLSKNI